MLSRRYVLLFGWILFYCNGASTAVPPCMENRTELCIQSLGTFIALDKPRFVREAELEKLCREAEYGQRCSSDVLRASACPRGREEVLVQLQIGRSQEVSKMLCSNGGYVTDPAFRKEYLRQSPCIEEHGKEMRDCYRSADVIDDPEAEVVKNSTQTDKEKHLVACCPLVRYMECSANVIGTSCGSEARGVVLRVLQTAAGKHLEEFCKGVDSHFPNSPAACLSVAVHQVASGLFGFASCCLLLLAWTTEFRRL